MKAYFCYCSVASNKFKKKTSKIQEQFKEFWGKFKYSNYSKLEKKNAKQGLDKNT